MKKLLIIGAGGLGREVAQYIQDINQTHETFELLGFIDTDKRKKGVIYGRNLVLGGMEVCEKLQKEYGEIYGFCAIANPTIKRRIIKEMEAYQVFSTNIIHPTAYLTPATTLGAGVLIAPNTVLTVDVQIGNHVHINPQCGVGHDTSVGDYSTLYWSVNLSGNVQIGTGVEIGSKAFVKQGLTVGNDAVIGAGAVVVKNISSRTTAVGVPAKVRRTKDEI